MFHDKEIPTLLSSWMTSYASFAGSVMVAQAMANQVLNTVLPNQIKHYLLSHLHRLFRFPSNIFTIVIDESSGIARNEVYDACEAYLCNKISPNTRILKISKTPKDRKLTFKLVNGENIVDRFDGIEVKWSFKCSAEYSSAGANYDYASFNKQSSSEKRWFEVRFHKKHKDKILGSYMPGIVAKAKAINQEERILKMHTLNNSPSYGMINWESINFEHPATFHTLAMEPDLKKSIMEDLDRFVKKRVFYKKVGRAWKRGYLLYGPPGTGKSSLVAAMANHLKFNVYDLQLASIMRDSDLRRLLLAIGNRSILVIEDIDCSVDLPDRIRPAVRVVDGDGRRQPDQVKLTLSGLLNFIDGLWSSCGDERIIVFTTNHKERLDPALLRPGRMDMHIHMSYCTSNGFRMLASNYLDINSTTTTHHHLHHHKLFGEIEGLIENAKVTPAQVAEELMKSDDPDIALEELVKLLKRKRSEGDEGGDEGTDQKVDEIQEPKRQKVEGK